MPTVQVTFYPITTNHTITHPYWYTYDSNPTPPELRVEEGEEEYMTPYLVTVFDEGDDETAAKFIIEPTWILASTQENAKMQVARMLTDADAARLDDLVVLVRPFVA